MDFEVTQWRDLTPFLMMNECTAREQDPSLGGCPGCPYQAPCYYILGEVCMDELEIPQEDWDRIKHLTLGQLAMGCICLETCPERRGEPCVICDALDAKWDGEEGETHPLPIDWPRMDGWGEP